MTREEIWALPVNISGNDQITTIKHFFHTLLLKVWIDEEGFNGKHPWGNSGWTYDVFKVLIQHSLIPGIIDESGYIEEVDEDEAKAFIITEVINPIFNGGANPHIKE